MVPSLSAGRGLGRIRSDQRHRRQPRPDPGRRRARPWSGRAALRDVARGASRLYRHDRGRAGALGRRPRAVASSWHLTIWGIDVAQTPWWTWTWPGLAWLVLL